MAQHEIAPATQSPNKVLWLAALDALEQEYLKFQRAGSAGCSYVDHLTVFSSANVVPHHPNSDAE